MGVRHENTTAIPTATLRDGCDRRDVDNVSAAKNLCAIIATATATKALSSRIDIPSAIPSSRLWKQRVNGRTSEVENKVVGDFVVEKED